MDRSETSDAAARRPWSAAPLFARETVGTIYVWSVIGGACAFFALLAYAHARWSVLPPLTPLAPMYALVGIPFFMAVAWFAEKNEIPVGSGASVSATLLAEFIAAAFLGPLPGAFVALWRNVAFYKKGEGLRTAFNAAAFANIVGATGLVYWWLYDVLGGGGIGLLAGGLAGGLAYQVLNWGVYYPIAWSRRGMGPREWFDAGFRPFLPFHAFFLALSLGLLYSFQDRGVFGFGLTFLPILGLIYAFRTFARQREQAQSLERFSFEIAASMITALDLKDNYTAQHSAAVAQYSFDTAVALGLPPKTCNLAHLAGLLHDLGKISVPDGILNSAHALDPDEWDTIRRHTTDGQKIVSNMNEFSELGNIILYHHERYDGQGYPHGLEGEAIPLLSRIVAVADSYSAMVTTRPYRVMRASEEAMAELRSGRGRQFDPVVVGAFLDVLGRSSDAYRTSDDADFQLQFQKVRFLSDIA